jgi:hypothetical protein
MGLVCRCTAPFVPQGVLSGNSAYNTASRRRCLEALDNPMIFAQEILDPELQRLLIPAAGVLLALVAMAVALRMWTRLRRRRPVGEPQSLEINVAALGDAGPPAGGPALSVHHVPVRLALLVLAPVGRGSELPRASELPQLLDNAVPGLGRLLGPHGTRIKLWPPQLSTHGFAAALFANVRLPGDRGKGTPWCSIAGKFMARERGYLAGLVLRAAAPNSLGQLTLERDTDWLDALRITEKGIGTE